MQHKLFYVELNSICVKVLKICWCHFSALIGLKSYKATSLSCFSMLYCLFKILAWCTSPYVPRPVCSYTLLSYGEDKVTKKDKVEYWL